MAVNVVQVMDNIVLPVGEYLRLNNFNSANFISQESNAYNQSLMVKITNAYENFKFDLFIFDIK